MIIFKKNINVLITKLIQNVGEHDTPIAYETNVNDIENIYMGSISFDLTFESEKGQKKLVVVSGNMIIILY